LKFFIEKLKIIGFISLVQKISFFAKEGFLKIRKDPFYFGILLFYSLFFGLKKKIYS